MVVFHGITVVEIKWINKKEGCLGSKGCYEGGD
jgi:hypothetical protein